MTIKANSCRRLRDPAGSPGQALAEMAFVLPILLILVFGIIEMSLAWRTSQIVTNATREGARLAVLPDSVDGDVNARIESVLSGSGLPTDDVEGFLITLDCRDAEGGDDGSMICEETGNQTVVHTDYPYQFRLLGPLVELAGGQGDRFGLVTISSTSTMRRE